MKTRTREWASGCGGDPRRPLLLQSRWTRRGWWNGRRDRLGREGSASDALGCGPTYGLVGEPGTLCVSEVVGLRRESGGVIVSTLDELLLLSGPSDTSRC